MPPKSVVQSESLRAALVSIVLIALLGAAVGVALWMEHSRAVVLKLVTSGNLELDIPADWPLQQVEVGGEGLGQIQTFADPSPPFHRLHLAILEDTAPRSPYRALRQAVGAMAGATVAAELDRSIVDRMRAGEFVIIWTWAMRKNPTESLLIAALTRDARHYWVLTLANPIRETPFDDAEFTDALQTNQSVLRRICLSARQSRLAGATTDDLRQAELAFGGQAGGQTWETPPGFQVHASRTGLPGQPIEVSPATDYPYLCVMRVRGTCDADVDDPEDPLFPSQLLLTQLRTLTGEDRPTESIDRVQVAGRSVWEMATASHIGPEGPLDFHRRVAFVRLGRGRALLVETFCEPQLAGEYRRWLAAVVRAAQPTAPPKAALPIDPSAAPLANALRRGTQLAQWQRDALLNLAGAQWEYELIYRDLKPVAYRVRAEVTTTGDTDWPVHGRTVTTTPNENKTSLVEQRQWQLGPLGSDYIEQVRVTNQHPTAPIARLIANYRIESSGPNVRVFDQRTPTAGALHTFRLNGPPLPWPPPLSWPVDQMRRWPEPWAVVWLTPDQNPIPCVLQWIEGASVENPLDPSLSSRPLLLLRPIAETLPDIFELDRSGNVIAWRRVDRPLGKITIIRPVDRLTLLSAFPDAVMPIPTSP